MIDDVLLQHATSLWGEGVYLKHETSRSDVNRLCTTHGTHRVPAFVCHAWSNVEKGTWKVFGLCFFPDPPLATGGKRVADFLVGVQPPKIRLTLNVDNVIKTHEMVRGFIAGILQLGRWQDTEACKMVFWWLQHRPKIGHFYLPLRAECLHPIKGIHAIDVSIQCVQSTSPYLRSRYVQSYIFPLMNCLPINQAHLLISWVSTFPPHTQPRLRSQKQNKRLRAFSVALKRGWSGSGSGSGDLGKIIHISPSHWVLYPGPYIRNAYLSNNRYSEVQENETSTNETSTQQARELWKEATTTTTTRGRKGSEDIKNTKVSQWQRR